MSTEGPVHTGTFCTAACPPGCDGSYTVTREPAGGQGLREAIADALNVPGSRWYRADDRSQIADAVLALPELAALIADADNWRRATTGDPTQPLPLAMQARDLLMQVRRVRAYADEIEVAGVVMGSMVAREIRAALDGEPQP